MQTEPVWFAEAKKYIGLKEIPGPKHNAQILKWWSLIRAPFTDDETPWCAAFVGGVLEECGIKSTRSARALSYAKWGHGIVWPAVGAIAVKQRYNSDGQLVGGHVAFVFGKTDDGYLLCLGGNQGNEVSVAKYSVNSFFTFRWPEGRDLPKDVIKLTAAPTVSISEA